MADEVTDCTNKKHFVLSFRWIHKTFDIHDNLIGIYNIDNIKADTLVTVIKDVCISNNFFQEIQKHFLQIVLTML